MSGPLLPKRLLSVGAELRVTSVRLGDNELIVQYVAMKCACTGGWPLARWHPGRLPNPPYTPCSRPPPIRADFEQRGPCFLELLRVILFGENLRTSFKKAQDLLSAFVEREPELARGSLHFLKMEGLGESSEPLVLPEFELPTG